MKNIFFTCTFLFLSCHKTEDMLSFKTEIIGLWHISQQYQVIKNNNVTVDNSFLFSAEFSSDGIVIFDKGFKIDTAKWIYSKPENRVTILYDNDPNFTSYSRFDIKQLEKDFQFWNSEYLILEQGESFKTITKWTLIR